MTEGKATFGQRVIRVLRRARWVVLGVAVFLLLIRAVLPYAIERYVNTQLNKPKDYGGRVGKIHLQLYRGQYRIDHLQIYKKSGEVHVPLFSVEKMDLSIEWKELFHGSVVGQVVMERPKLNFVSGPTDAQSQSGKDENWNGILASLFPFDLNRFEITNGQVHFQNQYSKPPVDIYLNDLSSVATNLTNSRKVKSELPAGITAHATTIGGGGLDMQLQLNPMTKDPTYQVNGQLTNVDLTALNTFLEAYGKFNVAAGQFALFASIASKDGAYDGYVKVFLNHLNVFKWEKEREKGPLGVFWDAVAFGTVATILKNHPKDSLATRIPISGSYKNQKIGTWTAVGNLFRNAFIAALVPKIDEKITIKSVEKKKEDKVTDKSDANQTPPSDKASGKMKPGA